MLVVKLLQNVLDLPLELIVDLVHQVLEHFGHAELLGLLSQLLPREDGVESTVYVGAHLGILMLNKLIQNLQKLDLRVFALVLTTGAEGQIHEQCGRVLDRVVTQLLCLVLKHVRNPFDHV